MSDSGDQSVSYAELAQYVRSFAELLADRVSPSSLVATQIRDPKVFAITHFAIASLGGIAVPLPPKAPFQSRDSHEDIVRPSVGHARPTIIVADGDIAGIRDSLGDVAPVLPFPNDLQPSKSHRALVDEPISHLQYTSGSTGAPKGVVVTRRNLVENVQMLYGRLFEPSDRIATWLPMSHDMGFVGTLLMPVMRQLDLVMMPPDHFVRRPLRWAEAFDKYRATASFSPPLGFQLLSSRVGARSLDFSSWRVAVCGAEPIDPYLLQRFTARFADAGMDPRALKPGYGMAEATLAVTLTGNDEAARAVRARPADLAFGQRPGFSDPIAVTNLPSIDDGAWITSCGRPLDGVDVRIVSGDGTRAQEGEIGEISIRGASVTPGYWRQADERVASNWWQTGDAGFVLGDELYVLGRMGDGLKVNGQGLFAADIEWVLTRRLKLKPASIVALPLLTVGEPAILLLWEASGGPASIAATRQRMTQAFNEAYGGAVGIEVRPVAHGSIPRTPSGKPKRREAWLRFAAGPPTS